MVYSNVALYQDKRQFSFDFSAERITSAGGLLLLNKMMSKSKVVDYFANHIADERHPSYVEYSTDKLLLLRTLLVCCGYEDSNDIAYL